ncbi:adenine-specific DNA-methyltransferase [Mariniflexile fucanivorans]|uniref:site-specific DNA-methyltransferase (adenine-specific) n=1 Tax=Mariniflexile fucanivorans TaxID=264023 RepID=A0A4V2QDN7_9FLAO|nr:site-specific DNA-methyltransferase [Mariniflexile fucanivorans]TCL64947.1 adenine-specific DNA-methyltransferase [Mariniflexile fucanivorans]
MPTLNWIGKDKVINHHQDVPFRVLEHKYGFTAKDGQINAQTESGNKIVHGDNLEALKSLLPEYEGKIKCIYIDPPYNTGNESWVYNDNVNHPKIKKWLGEVVGKDGEDLTRHDKWLCMMYPRLQLLHKLLADDGAIFISIDDNEQANLKLICDEIFGVRNFLGLITRKQSSGSKNDTGSNKVITTADYILPYKKNTFEFHPYQIKNNKKFNLKDKDGFFSIRALEMQGGGDTLPQRTKMGYSVFYNQKSKEVRILFDYNLENQPVYEEANIKFLEKGFKCYRPRKRGNEYGIWRWGSETFLERFNKNLVHFDKGRVYMKERAVDYVNKYPEALLDEFLNTQGTNELKEIFDTKKFDFPKPSELVKFIGTVSTDKNSIILDSFAGSGTTAHAVLNLNKQDGGNRKFILIEMEDYANDITAERVKRVAKGYGKDTKKVDGTGGAFDFYELGLPLFGADQNLNEEVGIQKIREYIWFSETRTTYAQPKENTDSNYLLGKKDDAVYYFIYEKNQLTTLDFDALEFIKTKGEQYIIYADNCLLPKEFMSKNNIIFKKIPRDITRF